MLIKVRDKVYSRTHALWKLFERTSFLITEKLGEEKKLIFPQSF